MREEWVRFVRGRLDDHGWVDPDGMPGLVNALRTIVDVCETSNAGAETTEDRAYAQGMTDAVFALMYVWKDHPDYPPNRHGSVFEVIRQVRATGLAGHGGRKSADFLPQPAGGTEPPPAPELRVGACPVHTGKRHVQVRSGSEWLCLRGLADLHEEPEALEPGQVPGEGRMNDG
jgi:hypothetical protein